MSYYQKYRPQNLNELVGQEVVKQSILQAFLNSKLSHAYLFVGPRGTGKTSTARILAKMVNCEIATLHFDKLSIARNDEVVVPCNKCSTCLSITDGSNLDLIEIDAASNRGIEDIRSLREKIKLAPTSAKKKVYIIDEVHMLTQEAFNALLKTLEEPPNHVLFILATTEAGKIPQTILSRCTRLNFNPATSEELKKALENIIKSEKIDIEDEALGILIKKADGSFRDGVKMLDQIASKGGKINATDITGSFRLPDVDGLEGLIKSISERNTEESLLKVQKFVSDGLDMKEVILTLMDYLRNMMLIKNGLGKILIEPNFSKDKYEAVVSLAEKFGNKDLIKTLEELQKALEKLKFAVVESLPLELAILEICGGEDSVIARTPSPSVLRTSVSKDLSRGTKPALPADRQSDKEIATLHFDKLSIARNDEMEKPIISSETIEAPIPSVISKDSDSPDILKLKEKWTFVLETIKPYNFSLEAMLRSVKITSITETAVIMEVPYSFHQRILEAPKNRDLLEGVLSDVLGKQIKVSCILGNRSGQSKDIENIEVAQDDEIIRIASEIFNSDSVN